MKHALAVEAAVGGYARRFGENEDKWGIVGLLHDFDYERWPTSEDHPFRGAEILRGLGYLEWVIRAILSHADYSGVPRETLLEKTLFACDELAGFVTAASLVRPSRSKIYNGEMQDLIRHLLAELGEAPDREGLVNTPKRVEEALKFLTSGYGADVDAVINNALFTVDYSEMVIVKDVDFYSLCEHHLLPFFGKCHVAYIPSDKVIGLSKIPRLVDIFSRRLQVQERLTNQIADTIHDKIAPLGVAVVMEATHLCMSMRGVQKQNSFAVTSAMQGVFRTNARTRIEFLELLKLRSVVVGAGGSVSANLACLADD